MTQGKGVISAAKKVLGFKPNKDKVRAMVVESTKSTPLSKQDLDILVDSISSSPEAFSNKKLYDRAINFFVKAYNTARLKSVKDPSKQNTALPGENHQPVLLENGAMTVAKYSGPNTQIFKRLSDELKKVGNDASKLRGVSPLDTIALLHDIDYGLAKNIQDIQAADKLMISRAKEVLKKGLDNKYNYTGAVAIALKHAAEKAKLLDANKFADFTEMKPEQRELLERIREAITPQKVGFGLNYDKAKAYLEENLQDAVVRAEEAAAKSAVIKKIKETADYKKVIAAAKRKAKKLVIKEGGGVIPKRIRQKSQWDTFLLEYRKSNPELTYKEAMTEAAKVYNK